jgi:uncharacterized protein HemX
MTNNYSQNGLATSIVLAAVAVVLVLGGVVYYYTNQFRGLENKKVQEKIVTTREVFEQKEGVMVNKEDGEMVKKNN